MSHEESVKANINSSAFGASYDQMPSIQTQSKLFAESIINFDTTKPRKTPEETKEAIDDEKIIHEFQKLPSFNIPGNVLAKDSTIIDFACGTGIVIEQLARFIPNGEVVGIDINQNMLDVFDKRAEKLKQDVPELKMSSICSDIMSDSFDITPLENKADLLLCSLAFHHFHDYKKIAQVLKRMVKPGGWIFIYDIYNEDAEKTGLSEFMKNRAVSHHGLKISEMNDALNDGCENVSSAREFRVKLWQEKHFIESHCTEDVIRTLDQYPQSGSRFLVDCSVILGIAQKTE